MYIGNNFKEVDCSIKINFQEDSTKNYNINTSYKFDFDSCIFNEYNVSFVMNDKVLNEKFENITPKSLTQNDKYNNIFIIPEKYMGEDNNYLVEFDGLLTIDSTNYSFHLKFNSLESQWTNISIEKINQETNELILFNSTPETINSYESQSIGFNIYNIIFTDFF